MRRAALLAFVALVGCDEPDRYETAREVALLKIDLATLQARVSQLESDNKSLKERVSANANLATSLYDAHESLRKTFNRNVVADNEYWRKKRTAEGVCGQETVWFKDGSYTVRNKDCPLPPAK